MTLGAPALPRASMHRPLTGGLPVGGLHDAVPRAPPHRRDGPRESFANARIFVAIVVDGVPLDALVAELGSNRNGVYKTSFDARRKLRAALVTGGYLDDDQPRLP